MEGNWIIDNGHLALNTNDGVISPTAEEIYNFERNGVPGSVCGYDCDLPSHSLTGLRFSRIGIPVTAIIELLPSGQIHFSVFTEKKGVIIPIDIVNGKLVDHCIFENVWYYVSANAAELQETIDSAKIKSCGNLSFNQYLKLVEQTALKKLNFIQNNVDVELLKNPIDTNDQPPVGLQATLYPYQRTGFLWIKYMLSESGGCILGDEMGLGKTMQVICVMLSHQSQAVMPTLVVAPISLLANWEREISKFAPSLKVKIHHGALRISNYKEFHSYDVIVTSYTTVVSDIHMLKMVEWDLVVLDEAQNIKNPYSQRTKACKALYRKTSIAVSGTPFENHVSDIWSLTDFALPKLLGTLQDYNEAISDDVEGGERIEPILTPLMIRRLVKDVAQDLPDKIVSSQPIQMSEQECTQYKAYLDSIMEDFDESSVNLGMLQKLRIYCTHPFTTMEGTFFGDPTEVSIKYQRLCEIVGEIVDLKEKVIVFTSYKKMFDVFKRDIPARFGIKLWCINGETPVDERQSIVDKFNQLPDSAMLVLNPRAAGTGLNITGANHVIHYNLEWNPSLEDQASARAYRRGQAKTVFVYRLYYKDTVEEIVNERIERKRDIASIAIVGNDGISQDRKDIIAALKLIPSIKN
jgi:SNF2 family DNA or RNA helicase